MSGLNPNKIFVFGLDNAGKTSLAHFIKTGKSVDNPSPTKAFDISDLIITDIDFRIWDAPGQIAYRKIWGKGMDSANMLMFVLDTADKERYMEAKQTLQQVLNDPLTKNVPLIFCFHKMDLDEASKNYNDAVDFFRLHAIMERDVFAHFTSIKDNVGLEKIKRRLVELVQKGRW